MQYKKLGRYELVRVLGKGAMGVVYEARDPNLDRRVAIKTIMVADLTPEAAADYEARFRIEARSAARLQHPNIVAVYDSDRDGDTAFLVMEYVEGDDLKQQMDRGERLALGNALRMVGDLLEALDFAHRQGVIHRDVKPANLLVEPGGRLKLTDFGVARIAGEGTRTQGSMIGTLKYMAPEQVQGQKVDARADIFSAAVVAYQLFTGVRPFEGDNDFSIIQQVLTHNPPPPSTVAGTLPAPLDAVFARALAKNRDQRYGSAMDFLRGLREGIAGTDMTMLPPPASSPRASPTASGVRSYTLAGAPITQELELEYWRAVRDSTDPGELRGFLDRFPEGVYADLARRRLDRLEGPEDPDATILQGSGSRPAITLPPRGTRTQPLSAAAVAASTPAPAPSADSAVANAPQPAPPAAMPPAKQPGSSAKKPVAPVKPARSRRWLPWAMAALVLVVGAGVWKRMAHQPTAPAASVVAEAPVASPPVAAAPAPAPAPEPQVPASATAAAAPAPVATPPAASTPVATKAAPVATATASAPRAAASRPQRRASATAAAPAATTTSAAPAAPAPAAPAPVAQKDDDGSHATASSGQRLVAPAVTCKDKPFLLREFCINLECAKPGYQNFPACVRLREDARQREERAR